MRKKGNPLALLVGMQTDTTNVKRVWRSFLKKLRTGLFYDLAIALLGIYPKNTKTLIQRNTCTCIFMAALSTIAEIWKQPKCPSTNEWMKKTYIGTPGWLSRLSVCLWLRSWSQGPGIKPHIRLPARWACFCLSLCLLLPLLVLSCSLSDK